MPSFTHFGLKRLLILCLVARNSARNQPIWNLDSFPPFGLRSESQLGNGTKFQLGISLCKRARKVSEVGSSETRGIGRPTESVRYPLPPRDRKGDMAIATATTLPPRPPGRPPPAPAASPRRPRRVPIELLVPAISSSPSSSSSSSSSSSRPLS